MSRNAPWAATAALLFAFFVLIYSGMSAGEVARPQPDPDPHEKQGAVHDHPSITDDRDCSDCHNQTSFKIVSKSTGATGATGFDHDKTGFRLEGRHRELGCTECHVSGRRINGQCAGCHTDPHRGGLGTDCDRCHIPTSFQNIRALEIHEQTGFPLTGRHAAADCTECHLRNGERQYTGVPSDCFACHEDEYRSPATHPVHTGTATAPPFSRDCSECHRPNSWTLAYVDPSTLPDRNPLTASDAHDVHFPISYGPHRGAPCESCHISPRVHQAVRCTGCHAHDPVRLRAIHGRVLPSSSGTACLSCHPGGRAP